MLKNDDSVIYVDHSILSTVGACKEKGRLAYVEHLRPAKEAPPLVFGSAFHAAIAEYYTCVSMQRDIDESKQLARAAFLDTVKQSPPGTLPLNADDEEKRSVERGLYLIDAYIDKWRAQDAHWQDVLNPLTNEPYIEVGFAHFFQMWKDKPVLYVGKIDRIRRNRVDGQLYNWETKTTGGSVKNYMNQTRPNHQITGYNWIANEVLGLKIAGTILDVIHISDRKVQGKFHNGIDPEKDFDRAETRRSETDVREFLFDLHDAVEEFLTLRDSGKKRWHRNAPGACNMYGGCMFRDVCNSNINPRIIESLYKVQKWEPWVLIPENTIVTGASKEIEVEK